MGALSEAPVNTVERALDGHVHVLLMNLAVRAGILGVAQAGAIVAPASVTAVVRAGLHRAILATPPRFAPARTVQAQAIV